jgi:hypothetical protein
MFSQKAARRRFSQLFSCLPTFYFFQKKEYFFIKIILHNSLIFAKFLKIKSQKSTILDCAAILKDFQKLSSTKC